MDALDLSHEAMIRAVLDRDPVASWYPQEVVLKGRKYVLAKFRPITIDITDFRERFVGLTTGFHPAWLVIEPPDSQLVFFEASARMFGACTGPYPENGSYLDLGFRSDDPFEMMCT